jgi:hypothetical protein
LQRTLVKRIPVFFVPDYHQDNSDSCSAEVGKVGNTTLLVGNPADQVKSSQA